MIMNRKAYVAYSILQTDAHMVYELGGVLEQVGCEVTYHYDHPEHLAMQQHAYDEVAESMMFVGLITTSHGLKSVLNLYQFARNRGIPCMVLKDSGVHLPGNFNGDRNIVTFRKFMPESPIRQVELWISHNFR
jgi:hypothetical protein